MAAHRASARDGSLLLREWRATMQAVAASSAIPRKEVPTPMPARALGLSCVAGQSWRAEQGGGELVMVMEMEAVEMG